MFVVLVGRHKFSGNKFATALSLLVWDHILWFYITTLVLS